MTTQPTIDQAKTEAFLGKVLSDTSGMTTTILASIGDRLGLFTNLAHGPATSTEFGEPCRDQRTLRTRMAWRHGECGLRRI